MALWSRITQNADGTKNTGQIDTLRDAETWPEPVVWRDTREVTIRWKDGRTTTYLWVGESPNREELYFLQDGD